MRSFVLFFALLLPTVGSCSVVPSNTKSVYGFIEKATLVDQGVTLPAKLDTGARSSSLHAIHIHKVKREGKTYVQFEVPYEGGSTTITCLYYGKVKIKPRAQEIEHITRPVVWLKIRLGDKEQLIRVNLTNRANFIYPLLLGRQAIVAFNGMIDPSAKYLLNTSSSPSTEKK